MWLKIVLTVAAYLLIGSVVVLAVLVVLGLITRAVLWTTGARDLDELSARMSAANARIGKTNAEWREQRQAHGQPTTLRGALKLFFWRLWKLYVHPIRSWRGEFVYPPRKDVRGGGGDKP